MSCRVMVRANESGLAGLTAEQAATLADLAHQRDEVTFKELARALGVGARAADHLWVRTVGRPAAMPPRPRPKGRRR